MKIICDLLLSNGLIQNYPTKPNNNYVKVKKILLYGTSTKKGQTRPKTESHFIPNDRLTFEISEMKNEVYNSY